MRKMLVNVVEPEECRIAVLDDGSLEELYVERSSTTTLLNNLYKGRVVSIEPSIQAAFVDFGIDKNGFLHVSDVMPAYGKTDGAGGGGGGGAGGGGEAGGGGGGARGSGPRGFDRRERTPIQDLLQKGQEVLVQVSKEEIGTKVPTLTTYVSLPGRYTVLMPSIKKRGVSKKIADDEERQKLRQLFREIAPPEGMGYILRTAAADRTRSEIIRDLNYLLNLWKAITKRVKTAQTPSCIYQDTDLVIRTIRDIFTKDIEEILIDEQGAVTRAQEFLGEVMPRYHDRVKLYTDAEPLFHKFKVEYQIEKLYDRKVPLPSGGSIVIDQAEALVAIDVNSGKFKTHENLEETAYRTNLEAAKECSRQLKLRDMGGVICIDFIDMRLEKHRNGVERAVCDLLRKDRARTRVARMSKFCILELTRQRVRQSIRKTHYAVCPLCQGTGSVKTPESMGLLVIRQVRAKIAKDGAKLKRVEVIAHPEVASYLQTRKKDALQGLEAAVGKPIVVKGEKDFQIEEFKIGD